MACGGFCTGSRSCLAAGSSHGRDCIRCCCCCCSACLHRNQRKKAALAFTKDAYSKLQAENQALLQQLEESNRESYQVSEQFRQELLGKNQKITELQLQLDQVRPTAQLSEHVC